MSSTVFKALVENAKASRTKGALPPVDKWDPPLSGRIDIRIGKKGKWHHEGSPIKRSSLVDLFASILKKENDDYFLVTPAEKWQLAVDDVPFFVTEIEVVERDAEQAVLLTTKTGDTVIAGPDHPITVMEDKETGEPHPYVEIRGGMLGRLSRNVYYELAKLAQPLPDDPEQYEIVSMGQHFRLF